MLHPPATPQNSKSLKGLLCPQVLTEREKVPATMNHGGLRVHKRDLERLSALSRSTVVIIEFRHGCRARPLGARYTRHSRYEIYAR